MSELPKPPRQRKRTKSDLVAVPFFLYPERSETFQHIIDIVGLPGTRVGQQVELRHFIAVGHDHAVQIVTEWMEDMNRLNPTVADKQRRRGFKEPPLPIPEEHTHRTDPQIYRLYFDRHIPAELAICDFLDSGVKALCADYSRQRLPRKLKQMYLRQATVYGIQHVRSMSTWNL